MSENIPSSTKPRSIPKKPCRTCGATDRDHHGLCRPCARRRNKEWKKRNPTYARNYCRSNVVKILLRNARERARDANLPFSLKEADLTIPEVCPILGIPLVQGEGKYRDGSPTLDRVQPHLGYTKENTRVISWRANRLKQDATLAELEKLVTYVRDAVTESETKPSDPDASV